MFQALNPVDGKVTGAGTINTLTHLHAGTLVIDKTLEALLSSTRNCSQLTELVMEFKDDTDSDNKDKIVEALSIVAQSSNMIAHFLTHTRSAVDDTMSSISINSLDTLAIEGPSRNKSGDDISCKGFESLADEDRPDFNTEYGDYFKDYILENEQDGGSKVEPPEQNNTVPKETGFIRQMYSKVEVIVLLVLYVVATVVMVEFLIVMMVYAITGQHFFEFTVEKSPESWVDKAKLVAFGAEEETVRIQSVVELFYRKNFVNILKYLINCLSRDP